ncbi:MAG: acetyl-CoA carboxylase biotin carboxyl carrier protein [Chloroflexaceae bacterium]|nr:acetyl-CoA carboxylase biotin carboxyl carrier protein [Chloroflexaceae bacterium]NJL34417.1 acetyl-CoA carboxylase biotin carboxyl carrier protein [Chloroflexaceae bacterium]NJO06561.1 acetyl-CoA carboxylase biotin carboxyl carrier protein [Chloroflexaceae bacterium]
MNDEPTPQTNEAASDTFGLAEVRELLHLLEESDVNEILIERNGTKLHIKRGLIAAPAVSSYLPQMLPAAQHYHVPQPEPVVGPTPAAVTTPSLAPMTHAELGEYEHGHALKAPMVGTFYSTPSPKDPPYVQEGDEIYAGDTVCIIEAMKIMNEIESDVDGRIKRILVKDGQPIEYGQALMIIEPL